MVRIVRSSGQFARAHAGRLSGPQRPASRPFEDRARASRGGQRAASATRRDAHGAASASIVSLPNDSYKLRLASFAGGWLNDPTWCSVMNRGAVARLGRRKAELDVAQRALPCNLVLGRQKLRGTSCYWRVCPTNNSAVPNRGL